MNRPRTVQKVLPCVTGPNICSGMVGRFANHPFFFNKIVVHNMIVRKKIATLLYTIKERITSCIYF